MRKQIIIILIFCFLFTGCIPYFLFSSTESRARKHMKAGKAHEYASEYKKAATEYTIVAEQYSDTSYYEDALFKAVLMNINPKNPKPDYSAALEQIKKYSELRLSSKEKQVANGFITLLSLIKKSQDNDNKNMAKLKEELEKYKIKTKELEKYKLKTKELENKLQKMKAIDVQMYKNKRKKL